MRRELQDLLHVKMEYLSYRWAELCLASKKVKKKKKLVSHGIILAILKNICETWI